MSTIFDRFRDELDQIGDRVRDAVESSRLHLDRSKYVGLRSKAAYKLGMLVYKRERGTAVEQGEVDTLMMELDEIAGKIAEIDRKLEGLGDEDKEEVKVEEQPAPPTTPGDAEVSGG